MYENTEFTLSRDCEAIQIPSGQKTTLPSGTQGVITQSLGGSYTIATYQGLARIAEKDLDALGLERPQAQTAEKPASTAEKNVEDRTRHVLREIFGDCPLDKVGVRLWDGTAWPDERPRAAVLALKHPGALGQMFLPGTEVGLAEAYLHNDFDIEGDIEAAFEIADFLLGRLKDWRKKVKLAGLLVALPCRNGRSTIRRASRQLLPRI